MALFSEIQLWHGSMKWENKENLLESEILPTGVPFSAIHLRIAWKSTVTTNCPNKDDWEEKLQKIKDMNKRCLKMKDNHETWHLPSKWLCFFRHDRLLSRLSWFLTEPVLVQLSLNFFWTTENSSRWWSVCWCCFKFGFFFYKKMNVVIRFVKTSP